MKKTPIGLSLLVLFTVVLTTACRKDHTQPGNPNPTGPIPATERIDTASVKLTQMVVTSLPSPYYQFTYNDSGYATTINFASGFYQYALEYRNRRVHKMTNIINDHFLLYAYNADGSVGAINVFEPIGGLRLWHYEFTYNTALQLVKVKWYQFPNGGADSLLQRQTVLEYHADGNVKSLKSDFFDEHTQLLSSSTATYDNYDNNTNVGDFDLLKDFFSHLLYLPGVKLQKNNARTTHFGDGLVNVYEVTDQFNYNNGLPQSKTSSIKKLTGAGAGTITIGNTTYTYK